MHLVNITYPSPAENLAIDEQLLKAVDQGEYKDGFAGFGNHQPILLFWAYPKKLSMMCMKMLVEMMAYQF